MTPLHSLADACGLARHWRDVEGCDHEVADDALEAVASALGHEVGSERQIANSLAGMLEEKRDLPAMLVADVDASIKLPFAVKRAEITSEKGQTSVLPVVGDHIGPVRVPGYYNLLVDGRETKLAVAPHHCPMPSSRRGRPWGVSLQIPSLRGETPASFGTFRELAESIPALARSGADAIAINPIHALFPGHGENFSPYSPSSRLYLNTAMGDPALVGLPQIGERYSGQLIDWENALPQRLRDLRATFTGLDPAKRSRVSADCAGDQGLHRHALFDALDCHFRPAGAHGWRDWPEAYRDPDSPAVAKFASEHAREVEFHLFAQWLARESLKAVEAETSSTDMAIGLISDLAVGVDPAGSDSWALRDSMLRGLTIGAPPDPLGPLGQNWSITSFSPEGLARTGYAPWIAMIRGALASCGGIRIDHAFGLARLWVIPEGRTSKDGAYLTYPFADLIRLATLEAYRAGAFVIAEDLGTAPHGFLGVVAERQMLGMRVLWFERAADDGFIGPQDYAPHSVAMTGTHDTVTVAGWWSGRDLDWAEKLGRFPPEIDRQRAEDQRAWDRGLLWSTIGDGGPRPANDDPQPVVDAAVSHVAKAKSALAIVPLEDLLGKEEQPNLPGTVAEHPNWRRRAEEPLGDLIEQPKVAARCATLEENRQ